MKKQDQRKQDRVCIIIDRDSRKMANTLARQDGQSFSAEIRLLIRHEFAARVDKCRRLVQTPGDA